MTSGTGHIGLVSDENTDALCAEFHADSVLKTSSDTVSELFSHAAEIASIREFRLLFTAANKAITLKYRYVFGQTLPIDKL